MRTLSLMFLFGCALASVTAAEPVVVEDASKTKNAQQPQLVIDGEGVVHLAYGAGHDVFYARSEDIGRTFSKPIKMGTVQNLALGMRRGPRIGVSQNSVCITVIGGEKGKGQDGDILAFRSGDRGKTWDGPVNVNDEPASAREGLHAMASSPKGELACVWLDLRHNKTEVYISTSTDAGKTWSKNALVYHSPSGSVCECCHPSVTYSPDGKIHVMWRNSLDGKRDMYHSVSVDGKGRGAERSFTPAQKLGAGSWPLDRCPMDGGSIAVSAGGHAATAWRRDKTVYWFDAKSTKEIEIGAGEQPWVTVSTKGPIAVWLSKRGQSLFLQELDSQKKIELAKSAKDPVIAAGGPKNQLVVVAWEDTTGGEKKIVCQRVE